MKDIKNFAKSQLVNYIVNKFSLDREYLNRLKREDLVSLVGDLSKATNTKI
jgi:hypothetical protein